MATKLITMKDKDGHVLMPGYVVATITNTSDNSGTIVGDVNTALGIEINGIKCPMTREYDSNGILTSILITLSSISYSFRLKLSNITEEGCSFTMELLGLFAESFSVSFSFYELYSSSAGDTGTFTGNVPNRIVTKDGFLLPINVITDVTATDIIATTWHLVPGLGFYYFQIKFKSDKTFEILENEIVNFVDKLYSHFISLTSESLGSVNFMLFNHSNDTLTIDTLKTAISGEFLTCSGYIDDDGTKEIATYITGENSGLSVGWYDISDGSTGATTIDNTFSISDNVKAL